MRDYFEHEWMVKTIPLGTTYDDFWRLNPRKILVMVEAYNEAKKNDVRQQNMLYHLEGKYFMDALVAVVGNMFRGRGQKPFEYPQEPYTLDLEYEEGLDISDDAERDIAIKRRNFVTQLNNMFRDLEPVVERKKKNAEH